MDIVERLRRWLPEESTHELLEGAATEIERLREELQTAIDLRHATLGKYMVMGCRVGELEDALRNMVYNEQSYNYVQSVLEDDDA